MKTWAQLEDRNARWKQWQAQMKQSLKDAPGQVRIGIFAGDAERKPVDGEASPLTNVEIGAIHEFGLGGQHERSFLRATMDANREKYHRQMRKAAAAILEGKLSSMQALYVLGAGAAADVKKRITQGEGIPPALAPSTIAAKGSSRPLVDTGQLVNSLSWVYVKGGHE